MGGSLPPGGGAGGGFPQFPALSAEKFWIRKLTPKSSTLRRWVPSPRAYYGRGRRPAKIFGPLQLVCRPCLPPPCPQGWRELRGVAGLLASALAVLGTWRAIQRRRRPPLQWASLASAAGVRFPRSPETSCGCHNPGILLSSKCVFEATWNVCANKQKPSHFKHPFWLLGWGGGG